MEDVSQHVPQGDVEQYLPGLPADPDGSCMLHCAGAQDDDRCFAAVLKGGRCQRRRTHGNFCKQHATAAGTKEKQDEVWTSWEDVLAESSRSFDQQQLALAAELSLRDNADLQARIQASRRILDARLQPLGLQRLDTVADGTCQFVSITVSGGIPLDCYAFRTQIVSYLRKFPEAWLSVLDRGAEAIKNVNPNPKPGGRPPPCPIESSTDRYANMTSIPFSRVLTNTWRPWLSRIPGATS